MCGTMHWFIPTLPWSYIDRSSTTVEGIRFVNITRKSKTEAVEAWCDMQIHEALWKVL